MSDHVNEYYEEDELERAWASRRGHTPPIDAPLCPRCQRPGIPIAYGLLPSQSFEFGKDTGYYYPAGCTVFDENWICPVGHRWVDVAPDWSAVPKPPPDYVSPNPL